VSRDDSIATLALEPQLESRPWAPLVLPVYRRFWLAGLFSNLGTWMHETGAQWLMVELQGSPAMVAAVRTAMTIPIFCLALPAGVLADQFDRRRWLVGTQTLLLLIALALSLLDLSGAMTPWLLLSLTACLGVASVLNQPAWQALTPELVPPALVPAAVAVGSVSFNLARSLGPALAGVLIATLGTWSTFFFNACSFLGVIAVLLSWRAPQGEAAVHPRASFGSDLQQGVAWLWQSAMLRSVLLHVFLFALPASCLWSMLSLIASDKLGFGPRGFGLLLGAIGGGAVLGAAVLPTLRQRYSSTLVVAVAELVFAAICGLLSLPLAAWAAFASLLVLGACWMTTMTTINATAQVHLPRRLRARGLAAYLMAFAAGMAAGSFVWGQLAQAYGLDIAFRCAAGGLVLVTLLTSRLPLAEFRPPVLVGR
jgi:predicted MFS family arabinose efflux permease